MEQEGLLQALPNKRAKPTLLAPGTPSDAAAAAAASLAEQAGPLSRPPAPFSGKDSHTAHMRTHTCMRAHTSKERDLFDCLFVHVCCS